jgi:hypothetical protein
MKRARLWSRAVQNRALRHFGLEGARSPAGSDERAEKQVKSRWVERRLVDSSFASGAAASPDMIRTLETLYS